MAKSRSHRGTVERMALFALIHSPSVGPGTWTPVASRLRQAGHAVAVPSLLAVAAGSAPHWQRVVDAVRAGLADAAGTEPVTLVPHSNAGLFVPVIVRDLGRPVARIIFADASVPEPSGSMPVAEEEFLPFLRGLADDAGRLPRWTDWWDEQDVAAMLPDPQVRRDIVGEQPRLPLGYYLDQVPVPAGWDDRPCGYLLFSQAYEGQAARARELGWPVRAAAGEHLHQVVDPDGVTRELIALADLTAEHPV
jgi:pimeloyl-ACP methyl ester carboxylesterase